MFQTIKTYRLSKLTKLTGAFEKISVGNTGDGNAAPGEV